METRSNRYLVAGVAAALLAALFGFIIWISPSHGSQGRRYEIPFERSVAGLDRRAAVTFAGISVGRVQSIRFDRLNPEFVRVRVVITNPETPILLGTVASIKRDLFGQATISLNPGHPGAPPIVGHAGAMAVIPAKKGGGMFGDPVSMVEKLSRTTERLNDMLSPEGQRSISESIAEWESWSADLADRGPGLADGLARTRHAIRSGADMAGDMGDQAEAMDKRLQAMHDGKVDDMRASLQAARAGLGKLDEQLAAVRPTIQSLSNSELQQQVRELHATVAEFGDTVRKVESSGISSLTAEPKLPDYESGN